MPAKSAKQFRFMKAAASGKHKDNPMMPSKEVAEEFISKTPSKKRKLFGKNKGK